MVATSLKTKNIILYNVCKKNKHFCKKKKSLISYKWKHTKNYIMFTDMKIIIQN